MTAQTAVASTVHHPLGKPGGPGLFRVKGMQLPAYIQNVAHAMIRSGKSTGRAIQMAIGIVRNWAEGHDGHGNKVSSVVQAAAAKAIAEYNADRARAIATNNEAAWEREIELAFNEALHPRGGAGTAAGGKFVAKGSSSPAAATKQPAGKKPAAKGKPPGSKSPGRGRAGALRAKAQGLREEAGKLTAEIKAAKKSLLAQLKSSQAARSTSAKAKAVGKKSKTATKKKAAVTKKKSTRAGGGASASGGAGSSSIKAQQDHIAKLQVRRNGLLKQAQTLEVQANKLSPGHGQALSREARGIELTGPKGWNHNWEWVGGPGLPDRPHFSHKQDRAKAIKEEKRVGAFNAGIAARAAKAETSTAPPVTSRAPNVKLPTGPVSLRADGHITTHLGNDMGPLAGATATMTPMGTRSTFARQNTMILTVTGANGVAKTKTITGNINIRQYLKYVAQFNALAAEARKHQPALSRDITDSYLELTFEPMDRSAPPETGADVGILGHQATAEEMVESINGMSADRRATIRQLRNSDAPPGYRWTSRNRLIHLSQSEEAGDPKVLAVF
jgi:hypothetical protein